MLEAPYVTNYLTAHFADAAFATLEGYERLGGYQALRKALKGLAPADVTELVKTAGLQGRGGGSTPAFRSPGPERG